LRVSFGPENLPYGVAAPPGGEPRGVVRLGDDAIDLSALPLPVPDGTFAAPTLNAFLALGRLAWEATRAVIVNRLDDAPRFPLRTAELLLPIAVGDYVDFYSSIEHATNVGRKWRPDDPLPPNWLQLPIGYHGRAGSVVVSGTPIARPHGLRPSFGPTEQLDVELELAFITGGPPASRISTRDAREHVFGFALLNDWSARDIQSFEYRPLGPFLGKSFATSLAAWITPLQALEPYLVAARPQDPEPAAYLRTDGDFALDIELEIELNGATISRTNSKHLYWTFPQQLAHATVNGASARPGDVYASGTISGSTPGSEGSLLELGTGFLGDGDSVVLRGSAGSVSLGEVRGTVG
jgi:fumarylacetoacetase